jgi:hypothetical protein
MIMDIEGHRSVKKFVSTNHSTVCFLEAISPISGTTMSVGYCEDLDCGRKLSIDNREGKSSQKKFLRSVAAQRPAMGRFGDICDGAV